MKSFSTKRSGAPFQPALPAQLLSLEHLFINETAASLSWAEWQKGVGHHSSSSHPRSPDAWHSPFWRKTEGFESGPPKLSSFSNLLLDMKATAVTHYDSFFLLFSLV